MKRVLLLMLILPVFLSACNQAAVQETQNTQQSSAVTTQESETTAAETQPTQTTQTQTTEPVFVYEGALEDYLLPIEEYSAEREFAPEFVMIHFISAVLPHREDPYNIDHVRDIFVDYNVSVHYIIERDGTVRCYIPEDRVAWHAGKGEFNADPKYTNKMNHYAIGIEIVAMGSESDMSIYMSGKEYRALDDSLKCFTQAQYDALKPLVENICNRYDIPMDRDHIIGHEEYSPDKTDPGELFDWSQLIPNAS